MGRLLRGAFLKFGKKPERIVKKRVSEILGKGDGQADVLGDKRPEIKERDIKYMARGT